MGSVQRSCPLWQTSRPVSGERGTPASPPPCMEHRKPSQAVAAAESVLPITRFSQLGEPPEAVGWWRPVGIVFVVIPAVLITVVVGAAALPLVLLFTLARRLYFCRVAYHTHPKEVKIAIIGGGWSGCQSMARLKELGVAQVTGFERHDVPYWESNQRLSRLRPPCL